MRDRLRNIFRWWGANAEEVKRPMAADLEVRVPNYRTTFAVTINAPPDDVWPWLIQMGYRRGGLYSYDWLDRLFGFLDAPSANCLLPEFQQLKEGDVIPIGSGPGFPVRAVRPMRTLLLAGEADRVHWAWQFELVSINKNCTRLISRNCVRYPNSFRNRFFMRLMEVAAYIMTRKMLLGIKGRAERLSVEERFHLKHIA